jgi:biopolymer transport protein ExbD
MVGRRVRCPGCQELVEVVPAPEASPPVGIGTSEGSLRGDGDRGRGTVMLAPPPDGGGDTVLLEAVDVLPAARDLAGGTAPPAPPPRKPRPKAEEPPVPHFRSSRLVETEMDMTPMVDVTFQLLIFFMITAAFALQKAKEIPRPDSQEPSSAVVVQEETALDRVTVRIDEFNTFLVINPDGDEEEAPSVQDLYIKLRRAKTGGSTGQVPTKLRVEAHGDSLHERVVAALDAGNETGFAELELTMIPDDAE